MYRLVNQQDGSVDCDINMDDPLSAALEALDYLGYNIQIVDDILQPPPDLKVVVEVRGGCAEVTTCPEGVEVKIIDHDNDGR